MLGTGQQHWTTVQVGDLADCSCRVLEHGSARGYYVIGDGLNPTVAELTEAAAVAADAPGGVPGSDDEAWARLGDSFAEVLLLDQGTVANKANAELGWYPSRPGLVDEFRHGGYRKARRASAWTRITSAITPAPAISGSSNGSSNARNTPATSARAIAPRLCSCEKR